MSLKKEPIVFTPHDILEYAMFDGRDLDFEIQLCSFLIFFQAIIELASIVVLRIQSYVN